MTNPSLRPLARLETLNVPNSRREEHTWNNGIRPLPKNNQAPCKLLFAGGLSQEAPVGVEPTMTDLQSVALATWLRSRQTVLLIGRLVALS